MKLPDLILTKCMLEKIEQGIAATAYPAIYESRPRFMFDEVSKKKFHELIERFKEEIG